MTTVSKRSFLPQEHILHIQHPVLFESGGQLSSAEIAYQVWGDPDLRNRKVIWVCHALTGNHRVHEWWEGLFGEGKCFDPQECFIVSVNVPSSCYGTSGPVENKSFRSFPKTTVRDMVQFLEIVRNKLEIEKVHTLIGASLGGQQVLEWAIQQPGIFENIIPIAANAFHSPFGIAFNEAQRLAIQADPTFYSDSEEGGKNGLIAARSIGMLSYRTYKGYSITQSEADNSGSDGFRASSYQKYQGEKLAARFNAYSYWYLSKAMDSHNIARHRKPVSEVLNEIRVPTLIIGVDSDILFPLCEQQFLAENIPGAELGVISSDYGHDGFLVEYRQLTALIRQFLHKQEQYSPIGKISEADELIQS